MPERTRNQRALVHRLNGQLLEALDQQMRLVLGDRWMLDDWIINVLMLNRGVRDTYTVRLQTSSTFYKEKLFQSWKDCDTDQGVGGLDFDVPLDMSFSGYSIQTGDVVWIEDVTQVVNDPRHPLRDYYRRFEHVAVLPDRDSPTGEYVFPILVKVGLVDVVLAVLNMEYFADGCPLAQYGQLRTVNMVTKLLRAHGPFLLMADLVQMDRLVSPELVDGGTPQPCTEDGAGTPFADARLLAIHRSILEVCLQQLKEEEAQ